MRTGLLLRGLLQFNMVGKVEYGIKADMTSQIITDHLHKEIRQTSKGVRCKEVDQTMLHSRAIVSLGNMEGVMMPLEVETLFLQEKGETSDKENKETMHNLQ